MAYRRKLTFQISGVLISVKSECYTRLRSEEGMFEIFENVPFFFYENFSMMERIKGVSLCCMA